MDDELDIHALSPHLRSPEAAVEYLERLRWPHGPVCPHCGEESHPFGSGGAEAAAAQMGVPFLGRIPLDPDVVIQSDAGEPFAMFNSDTPTAECYHEIANKVEAFCKKSGSLVKIASRQAH